MAGNNTVVCTTSTSGFVSCAWRPGKYGSLGTPAVSNLPGGRESALAWIDSGGMVWLFGGQGQMRAAMLGPSTTYGNSIRRRKSGPGWAGAAQTPRAQDLRVPRPESTERWARRQSATFRAVVQTLQAGSTPATIFGSSEESESMLSELLTTLMTFGSFSHLRRLQSRHSAWRRVLTQPHRM